MSSNESPVSVAAGSRAHDGVAGRDARRCSTDKSLARAGIEVLSEYRRQGPLGLVKLVAKAALGVVRYPACRRWRGVMAHPATQRIIRVDPRITFRHGARYLFLGLRWRDRLDLLTAHYAFVNRRIGASRVDRIVAPDGATIWCWSSGHSRFAIMLCGPDHHREGDLRIRFIADGTHLFTIAFSVLPASYFGLANGHGERAGEVIYIGQVQGVAGHWEAMRRATKQCMDIAPQDLLMNALAGLARAWNVARLLGPGPTRHLSTDKLAARPKPFDYAMFWAPYRARLTKQGHYLMSVPFPHKPIQQIVPRHRKRALQKREFKRALSDAVALEVTGNACLGDSTD